MAVSNHVGSVLYKAGVYMLIQIDLHSTGTAIYSIICTLKLAKRKMVFSMLIGAIIGTLWSVKVPIFRRWWSQWRCARGRHLRNRGGRTKYSWQWCNNHQLFVNGLLWKDVLQVEALVQEGGERLPSVRLVPYLLEHYSRYHSCSCCTLLLFYLLSSGQYSIF